MPEKPLAHGVLTLCARVAELIERDLRTTILDRSRRWPESQTIESDTNFIRVLYITSRAFCSRQALKIKVYLPFRLQS
jgi:hypothetical protein